MSTKHEALGIDEMNAIIYATGGIFFKWWSEPTSFVFHYNFALVFSETSRWLLKSSVIKYRKIFSED